MKENYQKRLEDIIKINTSKGIIPTLLLHSCCAPCSSYVIEYLSKYFKITIFYYNPNIDTIDEYNKRKEEQISFIKQFKSDNQINFIDCEYNNSDFKLISEGLEQEKEGGSRCHKCYKLRLEKTAITAKEMNFDYFTTTLTLSPYKNSKIINEIGKLLEDKYQVKYLYSDFKKNDGYKRSIELSKTYNLYRQDYCGCNFSKRD